MRFDYTKGKAPRYMVQVYRGFNNDQYYLHEYKEAKELYEKLKKEERKDTYISIYDTVKDIRKAFTKGEP